MLTALSSHQGIALHFDLPDAMRQHRHRLGTRIALIALIWKLFCAGLGGCGPHLGGKKALGIDLVVLMAKLTQDSEKAILTSSKVGVDGTFNDVQFIKGMDLVGLGGYLCALGQQDDPELRVNEAYFKCQSDTLRWSTLVYERGGPACKYQAVIDGDLSPFDTLVMGAAKAEATWTAKKKAMS